MATEYGLYIDGASVEPESGDVRELHEPATGDALAHAAIGGEADVDRAVAAARTALDGPWGKTSGTERSRLLHAFADAVGANRKELAELESRNVGKAISSVKAELAGATEQLRFMATAIASIAGRSAPIGGSLLFYSLKEPVGVCGQIVPWNYPLLMTTWKLAPALAAGCTVVLKPDPQTPLTAIRLAELATEAGVPAGVINVVPGDGPTTGSYLVRHPGVDKIAFTGSTRTGGEIMRLALGSDQARHARARRQEPQPRVRRRRPRRRDSRKRLGDLLRGRPVVRGAVAAAGRGQHLRRGGREGHEPRPAGAGRRSARRGDADGLADLGRPSREGARVRRRRARRGGRGDDGRCDRGRAGAPSTRRP